MAGDPHRRLESIMSKLSQSASPRAKKPSTPSDGIGRKEEETGLRIPRSTMGSAPQCRPWDRGDLIRRLATFKAMTWFGKPKAISPVNCARRGWINVEMDVICCEACEARLLFSTPSSWRLQQVEKAAAVFSLKLDNGHKLLCPWIDNACDEKLALFPPAPPPALVDSYKERSAALLKLTALPVISSSAFNYMKSAQLESFLSQSLLPSVTFNNGIRLTDNPGGKDFVGASKNSTASVYYQAQKIISLCGWEACLLPYAVDSEDCPSESLGEILGEKRTSTIVYTGESGEVGGNSSHPSLGEDQYDPGSVVLDCKFCGARVGLWAFETVQRPLEYFTLIADGDQNESATRCTNLLKSLDASKAESWRKDHQDIGSTSKERPLGLNLTIAGGPPPTKQNFRPIVSFPIVSRHLRVEIASVSRIKDYSSSPLSCENHENTQFHLQNDVSSQQQKDLNGDVDARLLKRKRNGKEVDGSENDHVSDPSHSKEELQVLGNGFGTGEKHSGVAFESKRDNTQEVHSLHGGTDGNVNSEEVTHYTDEETHRSNINSEGTGRNIVQLETEVTNSVEDRRSICTASNANLVLRNYDASENNSLVDLGDTHNSDDGTILTRARTSENDHGDPLDIASCSAINATLPTSKSLDTEIGNGSSSFKNHQMMKAREGNISGWEGMLAPAKMDAKDDPGLGNNQVQRWHGKIREFDPIRQHRPFCPWIAPEDGESLPGWRLTLNALVQQQKDSSSDQQQLDSYSTSIDEGDDPIVSIRKLFMSPPAKRLKGSR
ncbi:uncharacterized protein A4U43_C06F15370 [Asparagus officinalis]|uniref:C3HC-type domain-containing protein n=1 Tax=Asparagus officinalis TaxID=4686 RepID=A0A5P1EM42_ASPOF|nr:uncharacterized protein LOC109846381 isoform X2 [Asparagus officinalis]ONK67072.1 uncharacterized protein A4U43_C06F15370 [Asparagus officinalis]